MRDGLVPTLALTLIVALPPALLGVRCDAGESGEPLVTTASLATADLVVPPLTPFDVDVQLHSRRPVHAFDLSVGWDADRLAGFNIAPHAEFDDDSQLLLAPRLVPGSASGIVDLRHGRNGVSGRFKVATLRFVSGATPGPTSIAITYLGISFVDGNQPDRVVTAPLEIRIGP